MHPVLSLTRCTLQAGISSAEAAWGTPGTVGNEHVHHVPNLSLSPATPTLPMANKHHGSNWFFRTSHQEHTCTYTHP